MIQALSTQVEDLTATVDTLKEELISSHEEAERATRELDDLRARSLQESSQESFHRERELRECQLELEKARTEKDEWERLAMHEKALSEDARTTADELRRDLEMEREARKRDEGLLAAEQEKAANLQSVLQDFQAGTSAFTPQETSAHVLQRKTMSCGRPLRITMLSCSK